MTENKAALIYEDERLYVSLASFPLTKGHTVVVWKEPAADLHLLTCDQYEYLMDIVDVARDVLLDFYGVEKVYLMYMDETRQVHWHLIPRYDEKGFNVLNHTPKEVSDFPDAGALGDVFASKLQEKMRV